MKNDFGFEQCQSTNCLLLTTLIISLTHITMIVCLFVCFLAVTTLWLYFHSPVVGFSLLIHQLSGSHNDAPHFVGLLWTSDQSVAETST